MRDFRKDLHFGNKFEIKIKKILGATEQCEYHLGDFQYKDVYVEVKTDLESVNTGNACFEWADWYPRDKTVWVTGIFKHMTQPGYHAVVHLMGDKVVVYSPGAASGWLMRKKHTIHMVKPWDNGNGYTHGAIVPISELPEQIFYPVNSKEELQALCSKHSKYSQISDDDAIRTVQWFMKSSDDGLPFQETIIPMGRTDWRVKKD